MKTKIETLIQQLTFEEKCLLLTGGGPLSTAEIERLNIPKIEMSDGPHGIRRLGRQVCHIDGGDTCFPTASAVGASWNREVARLAGQGIANDCRQEGIDLLLAPATNMKRTPLCGRNFEYFSEDPVLAGELCGAFIDGVQKGGVGTSLKHFAANNQELSRDRVSVDVDERVLREYYLEPFRIAVEKGNPETVMCAYNKLCGIWCSENKWLLDDVLRKEWGYNGILISDWGAVHDPSKALSAGMELQMPQDKTIVEAIKGGLEKGIISETELDNACRHILEFVFHRVSQRVENPPYDRAQQHKMAYDAAAESITLLKNDDNILPINKDKCKRIVVFGECAVNPIFMGGGSSRVTVKPDSVDIPYDCIKKLCDDNGIEVEYVPIYAEDGDMRMNVYRMFDKAKSADVSIVFAGYHREYETEAFDRTHIYFPEELNEGIARISEMCENTVVVMQTGSCTAEHVSHIGAHWAKEVKGLIQMWLAGEAGGSAIADILFGYVNPSGKLSETFTYELSKHLQHRTYGHSIVYSEGLDVGYRYFDKHPELVWFPFGHGLSYTTFEYSNLVITPNESDNPNTEITATFTLKNTGKVAGKEVVQLYIEPLDPAIVRPIKELKNFEKIELQPGESKQVTFKITPHDLSHFNPYLKDWHVESGNYAILIAASAADIRLKEHYYVKYDSDYTKVSERHSMIL